MKKNRLTDQHFLNHLKSSGLCSSDSRGLVAVSGGVDSVVLLDLLITVSESLRLKFGIVHVNHKTRGQESDEDEQFVKAIAGEKRLPFYCSSLPLQPPEQKDSWEAYARRFRYEFFEKTREEGKYEWVATGHHANDQAETILKHVIEGSGVGGLKGIWEQRSFVFRPLLPFTKQQIVGYAKDKKLTFRDDPSNADRTITRNYIRHELVPKVLILNPDFPTSVSRLAKNAQELENMIQVLVKEKVKKIVSMNESGIHALDATLLLKEPVMIQKRLIHHIVVSNYPSSLWRYPVWSNLEIFLNTSSIGDMFNLPGEWRLLRDRKQFLLQHNSEEDTSSENSEVRFQTDLEVSVSICQFSLQMKVFPVPVEFLKNPCIEFVDFSRLSGKVLILRLWQSGDRMKPLGVNGYKKVSDILVDAKINRFEKENQFVLIAGNEIVWLCGIRLDDRYKIRKNTRQVARLTWCKNTDNE